MINRDRYNLICEKADELPEKYRDSLTPALVERLDGHLATLFPELSFGMPLTYRALESNFSGPKMAFIEHPRALLGLIDVLIFEGEKKNVIASLKGALFNDVLPFDEHAVWLPNELRFWYAITDGFQLSNDEVPSLNSFDLPVHYSGRRTAAMYCKMRGYPTSAHLPFSRAVGSKHLDAWIMLDNSPQAVFINEESDEGKLYHVHGDDFKNFYELKNPVNTIDRYCAHVLSGGEPSQFDFRAEQS